MLAWPVGRPQGVLLVGETQRCPWAKVPFVFALAGGGPLGPAQVQYQRLSSPPCIGHPWQCQHSCGFWDCQVCLALGCALRFCTCPGPGGDSPQVRAQRSPWPKGTAVYCRLREIVALVLKQQLICLGSWQDLGWLLGARFVVADIPHDGRCEPTKCQPSRPHLTSIREGFGLEILISIKYTGCFHPDTLNSEAKVAHETPGVFRCALNWGRSMGNVHT